MIEEISRMLAKEKLSLETITCKPYSLDTFIQNLSGLELNGLYIIDPSGNKNYTVLWTAPGAPCLIKGTFKIIGAN